MRIIEKKILEEIIFRTSEGDPIEMCYCIDPDNEDRRCTVVGGLKCPRFGHSIITANGKLYAIGG